MPNFTPSQPIIDFLVSNTETEMKDAVEGLSPSDLLEPVYKPLGFDTIYGASDGTMMVLPIVGSISNYDVPVDAICLSLGNGVTGIGSNAFRYCTGFTGDLVIPDSVTDIGNEAFSGCTGFTGSLTIGSGVTSIGGSAFTYCTGFTGDLTIGDGVTSIGNYVFQNCTNLTNVNCYTTRTVLDVANSLNNTSITTIHALTTDATWTAGAGQTIGGKSGITVIKDLT